MPSILVMEQSAAPSEAWNNMMGNIENNGGTLGHSTKWKALIGPGIKK